jgi:hypothetical protein
MLVGRPLGHFHLHCLLPPRCCLPIACLAAMLSYLQQYSSISSLHFEKSVRGSYPAEFLNAQGIASSGVTKTVESYN